MEMGCQVREGVEPAGSTQRISTWVTTCGPESSPALFQIIRRLLPEESATGPVVVCGGWWPSGVVNREDLHMYCY